MTRGGRGGEPFSSNDAARSSAEGMGEIATLLPRCRSGAERWWAFFGKKVRLGVIRRRPFDEAQGYGETSCARLVGHRGPPSLFELPPSLLELWRDKMARQRR